MTHAMMLLVFQLAILLVSARVCGVFFSRVLKQPRVLGELAAGMLFGPWALGRLVLPVFDGPLFPQIQSALPVTPELYAFSVVASIVLLFMAGLETDLPTFLRFSGVASLIGLGGVVVSFFLGAFAALLCLPAVVHILDPVALFFGTLATATSVGISARILSEKRKLSSPEGVSILAAAVLDDVLGIILLAVVVGLARIGSDSGSASWKDIGLIGAKALGFWLVCTVIGILAAPFITRGLKRFKRIEIISGIAFGLALFLAGVMESAGLAMIIGAYIGGLSLSQTDIAFEIRENLHGVYQFFVPLFFAIMGTMVNFGMLGSIWLFGLIFSLLAIAGKILGCGIPALLTGFNLRGAFRIGAGMLPRGEVTLIIAGVGLSAGVIGQDLFGVAIMALLISGIVAPPVLSKAFNGGSGYRRRLKKESGDEVFSIDLQFPSLRMTDFMIDEILRAFREEEFFVQRIDFNETQYHLRKDKDLISLVRNGNSISLRMKQRDEEFARLLLLEQVLKLKDFLRALESMKSPDMMGADLLTGLFSSAEE